MSFLSLSHYEISVIRDSDYGICIFSSRERTSKVLEQVRNANKHLRPGSYYSISNPGHLSSSASVKSDVSVDSDDRSLNSFRSTTGSLDFDGTYLRPGSYSAFRAQRIKFKLKR